MTGRRFANQWCLHLSVLILVVFLCFADKREGGSLAILGAFEYSPYVFILSIINIVLLGIGLNIIKSKRYKWTAILFTTIILIGWKFQSGDIKVLYWKIKTAEFVGLNFILIALNAITVYVTTELKTKAD